jgi:PAS domain S-box-containing protein
MGNHKILRFMFICLLFCFIPLLAQAKDTGKTLQTITVVSDDNYPPYIFRNANGDIQGILVDEWGLWEEKTGIKINLTAMDWGKAKEFMGKGKADVIDTIFFTEKRAQLYDFTKPYATLEVPVFFNKNIGGIVDIASLKGFTIGVKAGDACIDVLETNGITSVKKFVSYEAIIQAAADRQIKVFSMDKPPALYYLYKMNLENEFRYSLSLYTGKFHRAVKKGRTDLLKVVEDGFALITQKEHDAINKKWMGQRLVQTKYLTYIVFSLLFVGLIVLSLIFFNITLRRKIRLKTAELQESIRQLRASEERFRIIFEQAAVGVALCDSKTGGYIKVNQKFCDIIGYTPEEIAQLTFPEITHPKDIQEDLEQMGLLLAGKIREYSMEKRYYRKDNTIVWVKLTVSPMGKEGMKPSFHIAIVEDITRNKRKENLQVAQLNLVTYAQTHSTKELLQKVLDEAETLTDSQIGFSYFVEDDQKTLTLQTWSTNTLADKSLAKVAEHHYSIDEPGIWFDCIHKQKPVIHNDYQRLVHSNKIPEKHSLVIRELVVPVVRGDKIMAVLGVGNKKIGYEDHDVEMVQQLADMAWETITRKQAEEEIIKREIFLNAIIENIPNMLFVKKASDLRFIRFNKAGVKLIGLSKEEIIGKNDYDFFPQNEADFFTRKDQETLRKGESLDIPEETIQTLNKGTRILHTKKIPLFDQNGQPEYLLGISEDITERRQLEEQLRQTQKMESIGQLAGGIAHDFNNILSGIFGFSQLAKVHLNEPDRAKKDLDQLIKVAQKARVLVQQILAVSRKTTHKKQPLCVSDVVKDALKLLRATIPTSIQIEETIHTNATVMADPIQIHQVIMNLCTNAYHAMVDTSGIMTVCLEEVEFKPKDIISGMDIESGKFLMLEISDTGHGIEPAIKGKIFEPYFTTKDSTKGTGLGLAVVFGIVKEHKGQIKVHSEPGLGTKFQIYLPIIDETAEPYAEEKEKEVSTGTEKIMLVDDETDILDTLKAILTRYGYKVSTFDNGNSALNLFIEHPDQFDLVITDMTMPQMTGDKLSKEILKIRKDIPIIICTGYHENFSENDAFKAGIKKYVQKPVMGTELSKIIRDLLDKN